MEYDKTAKFNISLLEKLKIELFLGQFQKLVLWMAVIFEVSSLPKGEVGAGNLFWPEGKSQNLSKKFTEALIWVLTNQFWAVTAK